jgi:hypothetical protein
MTKHIVHQITFFDRVCDFLNYIMHFTRCTYKFQIYDTGANIHIASMWNGTNCIIKNDWNLLENMKYIEPLLYVGMNQVEITKSYNKCRMSFTSDNGITADDIFKISCINRLVNSKTCNGQDYQIIEIVECDYDVVKTTLFKGSEIVNLYE